MVDLLAWLIILIIWGGSLYFLALLLRDEYRKAKRFEEWANKNRKRRR